MNVDDTTIVSSDTSPRLLDLLTLFWICSLNPMKDHHPPSLSPPQSRCVNGQDRARVQAGGTGRGPLTVANSRDLTRHVELISSDR